MEILPLCVTHFVDFAKHFFHADMQRDVELVQPLLLEPVAVLVRYENNLVPRALWVYDVFISDSFTSALLPKLDPGSTLYSH